MKILVLCSGGDAPGMNRVLYTFSKYFDFDYARAGYKGLVEGDILHINRDALEMHKNEAGTILHSSRYMKFVEEKYFKRGLKNALNYDYVVVIGGNGSQKGAKKLSEAGVNVMFVPGSIDNDIADSSYSIGFDSAVEQCVYTIENCMPSANSFCHTCLFEVMGRDDSLIAEETSRRVDVDYVVGKIEDFKPATIVKIVKENIKDWKGTCIVVKEKIKPIDWFVQNLQEKLKDSIVKYQVVGRLQRGGKPTKKELLMADKFAKALAGEIKAGHKNKNILMDSDLNPKITDI